MSEQSEIKTALSKQLRRKRVFLFSGIGTAVLGVLGFIGLQAFQSVQAENAALAEVQADYQETWCSTFGAESFDTSVFDTWYAFVDRNRDFLQSKEQLQVTDGATGEVGLIIEWELDWNYDIFVTNGPQPDFGSAMLELAPSIFWSTDELLALGVNEFGKPVPLPCN